MAVFRAWRSVPPSLFHGQQGNTISGIKAVEIGRQAGQQQGERGWRGIQGSDVRGSNRGLRVVVGCLQWNGKAARPKTRICTLDLAIQQRDDVHGGGLEVRSFAVAAARECWVAPGLLDEVPCAGRKEQTVKSGGVWRK